MKIKAGRINSHNEWDPLREIIVGTASRSAGVLTWPRPEPPSHELVASAQALAADAYPRWYVDEIEEDLDGLCGALRTLGVAVHRPVPYDLSRMYATPFWASTSNNCYNARDLHLVVGNTVIESPSYQPSRYYEALAYYPIWYEYFE